MFDREEGGMTIWLGSSVYTHMHTHLAHSLTLYSLSFDMGCYCADSSGREAWLLLSWI